MTTISKVLITGASPDQLNRNTVLRTYVYEGFLELLGENNVFHCSLQEASRMVEEKKPNLVLCFGSCMPEDTDYYSLRYVCDQASAILAMWLHDDPYEFDYYYRVADVADYIFSNDRWSALHYDHPRVFHMPLAASKKAHWKPLSQSREIDFFFCGVAFQNRVRIVRDLQKTLKQYKTIILGDQWPQGLESLAQNVRLTNEALSSYYTRAHFTLNMGRDFNYANDRYQLVPSTPGPRTFEAAMAGATQLYFVESLEILDYYQPNKEILLFDSVAECERLMDAKLSGTLDSLKIGACAQERTLQDHTYLERAKSILRIIEFG